MMTWRDGYLQPQRASPCFVSLKWADFHNPSPSTKVCELTDHLSNTELKRVNNKFATLSLGLLTALKLTSSMQATLYDIRLVVTREIEVYVVSTRRLVWQKLFFSALASTSKLNTAFFFDREFTCSAYSTSGHRPQTITSDKFLLECSTRALVVSRRSHASRDIRRVMKEGYLSFLTGNSRLARPGNYEMKSRKQSQVTDSCTDWSNLVIHRTRRGLVPVTENLEIKILFSRPWIPMISYFQVNRYLNMLKTTYILSSNLFVCKEKLNSRIVLVITKTMVKIEWRETAKCHKKNHRKSYNFRRSKEYEPCISYHCKWNCCLDDRDSTMTWTGNMFWLSSSCRGC